MRRAQAFRDMVAGITYESVFVLAVIGWAGLVVVVALFLSPP